MADKPVKLQIAALSLESKTQQRVGTNNDAVKEYVEAIKNGATLPPLDLFFDGTRYYIGDGWHRVLAYKEAGHSNIFAIITKGSLRDAIFHAAGANKEHGVRRTNADKKQAVMTILNDSEWSSMSDPMIAAHCGVSHTFVQKCRTSVKPQLATLQVENKRTGKDGKDRPATNPRKMKPKKDEATKGLKAYSEPEETEDDTDFNPQNLPDAKIDLDALITDYKSSVNALTKVKSTMVALAEDEKYGVFLMDKITRITTEIDGTRATIKQMTPAEVCAACKGDGCQKCANAGFFTKFAVANRGR